jgi:myo-inositol-1(or 4)-monophosphatase
LPAAPLIDSANARNDDAHATEILARAALEAGAVAMRYFRAGERTSARAEAKRGGSPVTEADFAVDDLLRARLGAAFPDAALLTEERDDDLARLAHARLLVVDPIDGTRAFMSGDPRWTVSIALVDRGRPVAGIVHAPALGQTFAAWRGGGARRNGAPIAASARAMLAGARMAGPRPLVEAIGGEVGTPFAFEPKIPSLAWRLCQVAGGGVDLGVASHNAHDWDIAAADLILQEAGARLTGLDCAPIGYNRRETAHGILLAAPVALIGALVAAASGAASRRELHL